MKLINVFTIDDNEIDALISRKIIEHFCPQIHIHHFKDGKSAINTLAHILIADKTKFPQLILLDLYMPGMNGWQFLEKYQQLMQQAKVACVIYVKTNSEDIDHWIKARNNPLVENLIPKPFSHTVFSSILTKHFST
jgi:CheY-like chemotaxis protein